MRLQFIALGVLVALMIGAGVAVAAGNYQMSKFAVNAGATSSGGGFVLNGVAGQSHGQTSTGGGYTIDAGFAGFQRPESQGLLLPLLTR